MMPKHQNGLWHYKKKQNKKKKKKKPDTSYARGYWRAWVAIPSVFCPPKMKLPSPEDGGCG